jgi:NAD dependent epimerase/dehydratase family enzyme
VLFIPSTLTKLFFGKMSEMFLYGPKTKPVKTLNSNYKFKYPTLQEALLNLSE